MSSFITYACVPIAMVIWGAFFCLGYFGLGALLDFLARRADKKKEDET